MTPTTRRASWILLALALAVGAVACARILGLGSSERRPFAHREHVLAGVSCVTCHPGIASAGDDGPLHLPDDASCLTCHSKPHDARSCLGCHGQPYTAADTVQAREHLRFSHAEHQDSLRGNCARCHVAVAEGGERLRPAMSTCLACHQHEDQFADRTCDRCHVDLEVEGSMPASHMVHGAGWARGHGAAAAGAADLCATCHSQRSCAACHGTTAPTLTATLFFDDPERPSAHRAGFFARHSDEAKAEPAACMTCHAQEKCLGCHRDRQVAPLAGTTGLVGSPHPPGWVGVGTNEHGRAARRDPASCASCHGGAGEALCVSCHKVGGIGGTPHPPGWTMTSSKLSLRDTPCRLCHVP